MNSEQKKTWDRKGGRPKKSVKRDQQLAVMCTLLERKSIEHKAKQANTSISEFLRELALNGQVGSRVRPFPKFILLFTASLNHLAANVNQVAKKRNREEPFNALERAEWMLLAEQIKKLVLQIKAHVL